MPTHNDKEQITALEQPRTTVRTKSTSPLGYEKTDVGVTRHRRLSWRALAIFVGVAGVLCYGIGKVINAHLNKEDGPTEQVVEDRAISASWAICRPIPRCRTRWRR